MTEIPYRTILGLNQQTYQRLKVALSLKLRRQVFIAVCDDLPLRDRLAAQLQADLSRTGKIGASSSTHAGGDRSYPRIVSLHLDFNDPSPIGHVAQWLQQFPPPRQGSWRAPLPVFQILGAEKLTRQPASVQRVFLTHLQGVERNLRWAESGIILWLTQPWFQTLPDSVPEFWNCRTGVFEFTGDPTPLTAILPERMPIALQSESRRTSQATESALPAVPPVEPQSQPIALAPADSELAAPGDSPTQETQQPEAAIAETDTSKTADASETGASETHAAIAEPASLDPANNPWLTLAQDLTQIYESEAAIGVSGEAIVALPAEASLAAEVPADQILAETALTALPPAEAEIVPAADLSDSAAPDSAAPDSVISDPATYEQTQIANLLDRPWQPQALLQQIEAYQEQAVSPVVIATAFRVLGNLYCDRVEQEGESLELMQQAIDAYEQCLVWLPEASAIWVDVLNDLGNLYWMLGRAVQRQSITAAQNYLEQGIQTYRHALDRIRLPQQESSYAMVQSNLGTAYGDLARYGNPAERLQQSIHAYEEALRYRPAESDPLRYASTQNNLGTTYWNLAQHQQPLDNLKRSIAAYTEALHFYNPAQDPLNFAMIQNNLGTAFWNLAQYERPRDWLLLAVGAYRTALKYRTLEIAPAAFAATQNNLGTAFWHLANHTEPPADRMEYLQSAIAAYETALGAIEQMMPSSAAAMISFDVAATHNNQGLAHYQLATDLQLGLAAADQLVYLEQALHHHLQALQRWNPQPELRQTAMTCILQTLRACYSQLGLEGQNQALARIPAALLPEILPKL